MIDLASVDPKRHEKYSQNLHRWLRKRKKDWPYDFDKHEVYRSKDGALFIGVLDAEGFLTGSRLYGVLCHGGREMVGAWIPRGEYQLVEGFWPRYLAVGRCAIDTKHSDSFANAAGRYVMSDDGEERVCTWCGARHKKRHRTKTVTIRRFAWVAAA